MKLHLEIDDVQAEISLQDSVFVWNDEKHEPIIEEPEPGLYVVLLEGKVFRCELQVTGDGRYEIDVNGHRFDARVRDLKHLGRGKASDAATGGKIELTAPMPGKVVRILRQAGDEVQSGDGILVVEAMKMQNEMQSPRSGKVAEIRVNEGQTVNAGDVLAVIE